MEHTMLQYSIQPNSYQQGTNFYQVQGDYTYLELNSSPHHGECVNSNGNYLDHTALEYSPNFQYNATNYNVGNASYLQFNPNDTDIPRVSSPRSSVGKTRRKRTKFTLDQLQTLEEAYLEHDYIPKLKRMQLAKSLGLPDAQVKVWFQNRRCKSKKKKQDGKYVQVSSSTPHNEVNKEEIVYKNENSSKETFNEGTIDFSQLY